MTVITEDMRRMAAFLISEEEHNRSRDAGVVAPGDGVSYFSGHVMGQKTADSEYVEYDPGNADGSEVVAGILLQEYTGTAAAPSIKRTLITRDAQVKDSLLTWFAGASGPQIVTGTSGLAALGIIVREAV